MRCAGAGSADRVLLLLLNKWRAVKGRGGGGLLGSVWGRGAVPLGQALCCAAEDGESLGDVQGGSRQILIKGIEAYGLRR